jgi:hypothetical protein
MIVAEGGGKTNRREEKKEGFATEAQRHRGREKPGKPEVPKCG